MDTDKHGSEKVQKLVWVPIPFSSASRIKNQTASILSVSIRVQVVKTLLNKRFLERVNGHYQWNCQYGGGRNHYPLPSSQNPTETCPRHFNVSRRTRDESEALKLINARNEAHRQPVLNLHLARAYLTASDPTSVERTWQNVMEQLQSRGKETSRERYATVFESPRL